MLIWSSTLIDILLKHFDRDNKNSNSIHLRTLPNTFLPSIVVQINDINIVVYSDIKRVFVSHKVIIKMLYNQLFPLKRKHFGLIVTENNFLVRIDSYFNV